VGFFSWIYETPLAEYIRISAYGYPAMITLHSLGLAIMVGLSVVLSLRVLGFFGTIPYSSLHRLLKVAWIGFTINFLSGSCLFSAAAEDLIRNEVFLTKMGLVILGAILVATMQNMIKTALATGNAEVKASTGLRVVATLTIASWTAGMVTGRFTAYLASDTFSVWLGSTF